MEQLSKVFLLGAQRQKSFHSSDTQDRLRSIMSRRSPIKVLQHRQDKLTQSCGQ